MEPVKIQPNKEGFCECPECGSRLTFIDYKPAQIVDGKLNMRDQEAHYECGCCDMAFRRIVCTDFYQADKRKISKSMPPMQLNKSEDGYVHCPRCNSRLVYLAAPVHLYNGRLNMEDSEGHYECGCCNLAFRPISHTPFYQCYGREVEISMEALKPVKSADGTIPCPRCQEKMRLVEYEPVKIVDGKVNMDKGEAHYECDHCHLAYRRIVHTDFYQVYRKNS